MPGKHAAGAHQVLASGGGQSNKIRLWKYNMRNHWKAEHAREHGGLPEGTKKLLALASDEKLRVERRARKLGWWKPQQHVPCEKDDE